MKLTAQIKVLTTPESHLALLETMRVFNLACQFVSDYAFEHKVFNKLSLHEFLYREVRTRFCLCSQLTVRAFGKVGDAYRTSHAHLRKRQAKYDALSQEKQAKRKRPELRVCKFKDNGAVVLDSRLLTYDTPNTITLRALKGRSSLGVQFPKGLDRSTIRGEADLILQGNTFYLLQTVEIEVLPLYATAKYLGVDQGMVHLAYDSDGVAYDSPLIEKTRSQYEVRRTGLKQKKTKNSRRALKKMGKRLARFRKDVNHGISKRLVQKAKALEQGLAMENLTNFFDKTKVRRKNRAARHSWAFQQLRSFVEYKARREGVPFLEVEKAYSSQECSVCHQIDKRNRRSQSVFECHNPECSGYRQKVNADHNAAKILKYRAEVNLPELCACTEGEAATTEDSGRSVGIGGHALDASAASHEAGPRG